MSICRTCKWIVAEHIESIGCCDGKILFSTWFCDPDRTGEAQLAFGKCERYRNPQDKLSDNYGIEEYD